jgi:hypothetical protein
MYEAPGKKEMVSALPPSVIERVHHPVNIEARRREPTRRPMEPPIWSPQRRRSKTSFERCSGRPFAGFVMPIGSVSAGEGVADSNMRLPLG